MTITQLLGSVVYVGFYLRATDTRIKDLVQIEKNDLVLLKAQAVTVLASRPKTQTDC